jgi:hypothetical protein
MADTTLRVIITAVNNVKAELTKIRQDFKATTDVIKGMDADAPKKLNESLTETQKVAKDTNQTIKGMAETSLEFGAALSFLTRGLKFLAGGFLALKSVQFLKDLADTAARTETLGLVLQTVGRNAGYTSTQLDEAEASVKKLGITASAARESITKLIQARIPLDFAGPLARAAQDLAVVSGLNSSDTFARLITNIQQMDTMGLRFMGLLINKEKVFEQAAKDAGKPLDDNAKKIAFANGVLAESAKLNGIYETSLNSVGKMLSSLPRYVENLKVSLGDRLLPVYTEIVRGITNVLEAMDDFARSINNVEGGSKFEGLATAVRDMSQALVEAIKWAKENKEVFTTLWETIKVITLAWIALKAAVLGFAAVTGTIKIFGSIAVALLTLKGAIVALLGGGIPALAAALTSMGFAMAPLLPILGAIAAAVAAVVGVWYLWDKVTGDSKQNITDTNALLDQYLTNLTKSSALGAQIGEIALQIATLQNKLLGNLDQAERKRINNEITALRAKSEDLKKERKKLEADANAADKELRSRPLDEAQKERKAQGELKAAEPALKAEEVRKKADALAAALQAAGLSATELTTGVSQKLANSAEAFQQWVESLTDGSDDARTSLNALLSDYQKLLGAVNSPQELAKIEEIGKLLSEKAKANGLNFDSAIAGSTGQARLNLDKALREQKAGGAASLAAQTSYNNAVQELREQYVKTAVDYERLLNDQSSKVLEERYAQGLILTADYFKERQRLAQAESALDIRLLEAANEKLRAKLEVTYTPEARLEVNNQISGNEARIRQAQAKREVDATNLRREQDRVEVEQTRQKSRLQIELLSQGPERERALIAEVNLQYTEQLEKLGKIAGMRDLLTQKRDLDIEKIKLDEANRAQEHRIALLQSELNLRSIQIENGVSKGDITSLEAQEQRNQLIRDTIELREAEYRRQLQIARETKQNDIEAHRAAVQRMAELRGEVEQLRGSIKGIGDDLRDAFKDSLTQGISDMIKGTKSIKDILKNIGNTIFNSVTNTFAKQISEEITRTITKGTQGAEGQGSIFDQIITLITGKKPEPKAATISPDATAVKSSQEALATKAEQVQRELLGENSPILSKSEQIRSAIVEVEAAIKALSGRAESGEPLPEANLPGELPTDNLPPDFQEAMKSIAQSAAQSKATSALSVSGVRGIRNNNPGNLEFMKSDPFQGQVGSDGRFGIYDSAENGLRALAKNLLAKQNQGFTTVKEIIEKITPPTRNGGDNPNAVVDAYVQNAADSMGVKIDEKIDLNNRELLEKFVTAVVKNENGAQPFDEATIDAAVDRALGLRADSNTSVTKTSSERPFQGAGATGDFKPEAFGSQLGQNFESIAATALSKMGPMGQLASVFLKQSGIGKKAGSSIGSLFKTDTFKPNAEGVPRQGAYTPFESDFPLDTAQTMEKASSASQSVFDSLGSAFETNASDVAGGLSGGEFGIGDLFSGLGDMLSQGFDSLSSLFSGGGGLSAGAGGGGGDFWGTLAQIGMSLFAEEGGLLQGPSHSSGGIPVEAEGGEYIVNKRSTAKWLPILHAINEESTGRTALRIPTVKRFAEGGLVEAMLTPNPVSTGPNGRGTIGRGSPVNVSMNITTPDAESFRRSKDQVVGEFMRAGSRAIRKNGQ